MSADQSSSSTTMQFPQDDAHGQETDSHRGPVEPEILADGVTVKVPTAKLKISKREGTFHELSDNEVLEEVERNVFAFAYFPINKLIDTYPAEIKCPKKSHIYETIKGKHDKKINQEEELGFIRLRGLPYPMRVRDLRYENFKVDVQVDKSENFYPYGEIHNAEQVVWYVSFADRAVFGWFHKEDLALASEDVRALEHPAVCSLRNCLKDIHGYKKGPKKWEKLFNVNLAHSHPVDLDVPGGLIMPPISDDKPTHDQFNPVTSDGANRPTPILIVGAPRMGILNTKGIYGDVFRKISLSTLQNEKERIQPLETVTYTNFISIEALDQKANPEVRQGAYTIHQLRTLLRTAMSGFAGARSAIQPHNGKWPEVIIKTGLWGCGVYGNNPGVICLIQLAAAHFVGLVCDHLHVPSAKPAIQKIYFYIGSNGNDRLHEQIKQGQILFYECWDDASISETNGKERLIIPDKFLEIVEQKLRKYQHPSEREDLKNLFDWSVPKYD